MNNNQAESSRNECSACAEPRGAKEEVHADTAEPLTPNEAGPGEPAGGRALRDIERAYISRVFAETNHNLAKAARILEIDRSTLYSKLKKYGLK